MKKSIQELKSKSAVEIKKELDTLRNEIEKLSIEAKVNQQKDTNMVSKKKKRLAVLMTILGETKK